LFSNLQAGEIHFSNEKAKETGFYSNGWQSWSPSGTYQHGQRQKTSRLGAFSHPMLYNTGTPIPRQESSFSSDMFAALLDHNAKAGLLCGFLSQKEQFGSLSSTLHPTPNLKVWANCDEVEVFPGMTLESDWLAWQFFDSHSPQPFAVYFEGVACENEVRERITTPLGCVPGITIFRKSLQPFFVKTCRYSNSDNRNCPWMFFKSMTAFNRMWAVGSSSTKSFHKASTNSLCRRGRLASHPVFGLHPSSSKSPPN
jgi:hypothetical protein